jgi:hypothetical protein
MLQTPRTHYVEEKWKKKETNFSNKLNYKNRFNDNFR